MHTHICIFESLQLEGLYVGELQYLDFRKADSIWWFLFFYLQMGSLSNNYSCQIWELRVISFHSEVHDR